MWAAVWAVIKWIAAVVYAVIAWAVVHYIVATIIGVVLLLAAAWLADQSWFGAEILSALVAAFGMILLVAGAWTWIFGPVAGAVMGWGQTFYAIGLGAGFGVLVAAEVVSWPVALAGIVFGNWLW